MKVFIGALIVLVCIITGYSVAGGGLHVLWQPAEYIIIVGCAVGAFIIANPRTLLQELPSALKAAILGNSYQKSDFLELFSVLYSFMRLIKNKGMLVLDQHIDQPENSTIFNSFPRFLENEKAVNFLCDYLRMITLGSENPYQMDEVMERELEQYEHERGRIVNALYAMADGLPALGIVAAVLGVIHTMGSISQPPEILGKLIGAALVGTFLGVLLSYGFVSPLAQAVKNIFDSHINYLGCVRAVIIAHLNGYPPLVAVEYARKGIEASSRPTFLELEEAMSRMPNFISEDNNDQ